MTVMTFSSIESNKTSQGNEGTDRAVGGQSISNLSSAQVAG